MLLGDEPSNGQQVVETATLSCKLFKSRVGMASKTIESVRAYDEGVVIPPDYLLCESTLFAVFLARQLPLQVVISWPRFPNSYTSSGRMPFGMWL